MFGSWTSSCAGAESIGMYVWAFWNYQNIHKSFKMHPETSTGPKPDFAGCLRGAYLFSSWRPRLAYQGEVMRMGPVGPASTSTLYAILGLCQCSLCIPAYLILGKVKGAGLFNESGFGCDSRRLCEVLTTLDGSEQYS